jgi:hypothetical protein
MVEKRTIESVGRAIRNALDEADRTGVVFDVWRSVHFEQAIRCLRPTDNPEVALRTIAKAQLNVADRNAAEVAEFEATHEGYKYLDRAGLRDLLRKLCSN